MNHRTLPTHYIIFYTTIIVIVTASILTLACCQPHDNSTCIPPSPSPIGAPHTDINNTDQCIPIDDDIDIHHRHRTTTRTTTKPTRT